MAYLGRPGATAPLTTADIPDNSITAAKIVDATIAAGDLAPNSVDSSELVDLSIDTSHIGDNQVTLAKMAGGTDGQIITYDASGDPVAVGPGSDGQVLTSTGAGSPPAFEVIPPQRIVSHQIEIYSADASNYIDSGTNATWVGTSSSLNITHSMSSSSNMLIFTLFSSRMYVSTSRQLFVGIGLTSDLTGDDANIIRYASEGPGGDNAKGKQPVTDTTNTGSSSTTFTFKYLPATTSERIYQPIIHGDGSTDAHLVTNASDSYVLFSVMEVLA